MKTTYNINFASWFTGSSLNTVKHPKYGKAKITPEQIKENHEYANKLFKSIEKAIKNDFLGDLTPDFIEFKSNPANHNISFIY